MGLGRGLQPPQTQELAPQTEFAYFVLSEGVSPDITDFSCESAQKCIISHKIPKKNSGDGA